MNELGTVAVISTIPHCNQRYKTCGDWQEKGGVTYIASSDMKDEDSEFLVALHELVECYLCKKAGITDEAVTAFDKAFEAARQPGNTEEPGDEPNAPYRQQHRTATIVEMIVADAMGKNWKEHEENVNRL